MTDFEGNTVEDGGDSGIGVGAEGSLSFGYLGSDAGARNRIRNNAGHEIYIASSGSADLGGSIGGGTELRGLQRDHVGGGVLG